MILLDTNVLIYVSNPTSPFYPWAHRVVFDLGNGEGVCVNPIVLAEWCVGFANPKVSRTLIESLGVEFVPLPVEAAPIAALAYRAYRQNRALAGSPSSSGIPLPDFFIGAHAELMQWKLATADRIRYETYFPEVELIAPDV